MEFTTGKLTTLNNHLIQCTFCPDSVKTKAQAWKCPEDDSGDEAGTSASVTAMVSAKKHSRLQSTKTDSRIKQRKFNVVSAPAHSFNPQRQVQFENQMLRAFVSAGWAFNSITDPEVQKLFHDFFPGAILPTRQKLSEQILNWEVVRMQGSLKQDIKGAYATIQCNGWKDISKKHLVAFMYTANREVSSGSFHHTYSIF